MLIRKKIDKPTHNSIIDKSYSKEVFNNLEKGKVVLIKDSHFSYFYGVEEVKESIKVIEVKSFKDKLLNLFKRGE